jgi:hypothetical protein
MALHIPGAVDIRLSWHANGSPLHIAGSCNLADRGTVCTSFAQIRLGDVQTPQLSATHLDCQLRTSTAGAPKST